jgi:hypothetical protein
MWDILKAELSYNRLGLTVLGVLCASIFTGVMIRGDGMHPLIPGTTLLTFFYFIMTGQRGDSEKRERLYALLPVPRSQASLSSWVYIVGVQFVVFGVWLVAYLALSVTSNPGVIWPMFALNACVPAVIAMFATHSNLGYFGNVRALRGVVLAVTIAILVALVLMLSRLGYFILLGFDESGRHEDIVGGTLGTPLGAVVCNVVAAGLIVLSHRVYVRRRSFVS